MSRTELQRISTGSPGLDHILHGGLPANSLNVLMGRPGTGKTVLAEQILFANAQGDRPALYLTTLSEPLSKVLTYLQRFSFFDVDRIGSTVHYEDVGQVLAKGGIEALVEAVRTAVKEIGPALIVIDSFKVVHNLGASEGQVRLLLSELAGMLAAYDTTVILIGEYEQQDVSRLPEFAVADGVISLTLEGTGKADHRFLRVLKLRGSGYVEGQHAFTIDPDGIRPYPRLITPEVPEDYEPILERVPTGVKGLDSLLGGGLWRGSTALVTGAAGSGKTTLGIGFCMAAVEAGEQALLLNFQEDPAQLARSIRALGVDLDSARERGLRLQYASPVELEIDSLVSSIFDALDDGVSRVVIDAAGDLALAARDPERFYDYVYSLIKHFAARRVTSLFTLEKTGALDVATPSARARFDSMTDAIIELRLELEGGARRTLRVVKARGIAHDLNAHDIEIHEQGIKVLDVGDRV